MTDGENIMEYQEKGIIVGVQTTESDEVFQYSMDELENLVANTGIKVIERVTQKRDKPDYKTFIGKGKVTELERLADAHEVDVIIFNQELSPSQVRNLQEEIQVKIIDRIQVILDIFALRATSKEGSLQVHLAQLEYLLPRLAGHGINMSRLGGGIGTRGPGETKLETDRRHIYRQIDQIKGELKNLSKHRQRNRARRENQGIIQIGLIGYTNAGKSTIMKQLTSSEVAGKDILFATLDPKTRQLELPSGLSVVLTDTVGFIQDLPTTLVEAFHSTLEESMSADLLIHVIDASASDLAIHEETVLDLLNELEMHQIPVLTVYNKIDLIDPSKFNPGIYPHIAISSFDENDIQKLQIAIEKSLLKEMVFFRMEIPIARGDLLIKIPRELIVQNRNISEDLESYIFEGYGMEESIGKFRHLLKE